MRGISVTASHIATNVLFRKCAECLKPAMAVARCTAELLRARAERERQTMTDSPAAGPEPAFIEVGHDNSARRIAVRARKGAAPGLFWLGGFNSDGSRIRLS